MRLHWSYQVIRLTELPAEKPLALDNPALLSLIGLCKFEEPAKELAEAVARIKQELDNEDKGSCSNTLISLMPNKELAKMIQEWSSTDEFIRSCPWWKC
ncbi:MAG: hypothetical protein R2880_10300 [Deinococcales bacterium]